MPPPPDPARQHAADRWAAAWVAGLILLGFVGWWARPIDRRTLTPQAIAYRVPVNTADRGELEALPSIGPNLAHAVIEHRAAHGPFVSISAMQDVRGIGPKTVARLEPWVRTDPPAATR
ncbi:MAG: helix-hairpin-helix domain-containing protein [Planctomycetota bacterium]